MSVKLRLTRMGRKKRPFYRIIAVDSRRRRDGKYIEKVGHYDPVCDPAEIVVDHDIAIKWLGNGAITSNTVRSLFKKSGVMLRWDMTKRGYDAEKIELAVKEFLTLRELKAKKDAPAPVKVEAKKEETKPEPEKAVKEEKAEEEAGTEEKKAE